MSIWRMLRATEQINKGTSPAGDMDKLIILPEGPVIEPGPLPAEAQIMLRVMGEDLDTAKELIKAMTPRDRAILIFYTTEIGFLVSEVNQAEGRY